MTKPSSILGPPVQIAYAVPDATAAARTWVEQHGAGPFFVRPHIELVDVVHRGRAASFDHTSAYGQWGSMMVELVQDHTAGPTVIKDLYPQGGSGFHHLAFIVDDLEQVTSELVADGHPIAMTARTRDGTAFTFFDALNSHGHFFEVYAASDRLGAFYAMVAEAAREWLGNDPIRLI